MISSSLCVIPKKLAYLRSEVFALKLPCCKKVVWLQACIALSTLALFKYASYILLAQVGFVLNPYLESSLLETLIWSLPHNVVSLALLIVSATLEELVFRGFLLWYCALYLRRLRDNLSSKEISYLSLVISSIVFALFHLVNLFTVSAVLVMFQVCFAFVAGLYLAWLRTASKSILPSMLAHGFLNLFL